MSALSDLHARRADLLVRIAAERDLLALRLAPLERPARFLDRALEFAAAVRRHPVVTGVAVAVVVAVTPRAAWRWGRRAFAAWEVGRKAAVYLERARAGRAA